ncbi:MAG TPA: hypothetical protein PK018_06990 [Candidatus Competibacter sp.]|nr:hypothetical protein [Candidatus Competibacter sp.]HRW66108.1 hypothetical protein [Candidatus Competibacter sp.]
MDSNLIFSLKSEFTLREAAMALAGVMLWNKDTDKEESEKCKWILDALIMSARNGEINSKVKHYMNGREKNGETKCIIVISSPNNEREWGKVEITRIDLIEWCKKRGIHPPFLFPKPPAEEKPPHASEKNTLLAIIRAFAELRGIKSGRDAYSGDAAELLRVLGKAGIEAPCNEKTLAKHLLASFKAQ